MKKIFLSFSILITLFFLFLMTILATHGFETNRFNKFVSNKLAQTKNIDLKLEKIKFKIDLQNLSLFLETQNPIINFRDMLIPVQNIESESVPTKPPSLKNSARSASIWPRDQVGI